MNNLKRYENVFIVTLDIDKNNLSSDLEYNSIPEWDSVGHMSLIASLEEEFSVTLEMDDIIDFSSFEKGKEILKKYDVEI